MGGYKDIAYPRGTSTLARESQSSTNNYPNRGAPLVRSYPNSITPSVMAFYSV